MTLDTSAVKIALEMNRAMHAKDTKGIFIHLGKFLRAHHLDVTSDDLKHLPMKAGTEISH